MNHESWAKELLISELRYKTYLSEDAMRRIADGFFRRLVEHRHQVVPRYLTDDMYDAQLAAGSNGEYRRAADLYMAALDAARSGEVTETSKNIEEDGEFW